MKRTKKFELRLTEREYATREIRMPATESHRTPEELGRLGAEAFDRPYRFQGRDFRLTDVHGKIVTPLLA